MEQNSRTHVQEHEQDSGWYLPDGTPITHRRPLRLVELFSGIGAQAQALSELGVPYTSVCCEIDGRVHTLYEAVHCRTPNLGDITKVAELPECDVMTYSFPCQSLSSAGARGGLEEGSGTASSLVWEVMRLLRDTPPERRPQALVMENVEMLVSERFMPSFLKVQAELTALGYTNVWAKRSAVTDGLPQRRVRVFMVSLRGGRTYTFPAGSVRCPPLSSLLEDVPEGSAERRVMTENAKARYREWLRSHGVTEAGDGFMRYPCATRRGYTIARKGDGLVWARCHRARGTVQNAVSPTLTTGAGCGVGVWADGPPSLDSVRMLTPREAWRLMGFPDDAYDDAVMTGASPAQLYSAAGNSIAVPVLASIFRELLRGGHSRQTTLDIYDKEEEG